MLRGNSMVQQTSLLNHTFRPSTWPERDGGLPSVEVMFSEVWTVPAAAADILVSLGKGFCTAMGRPC
jgi:hypothetical protein